MDKDVLRWNLHLLDGGGNLFDTGNKDSHHITPNVVLNPEELEDEESQSVNPSQSQQQRDHDHDGLFGGGQQQQNDHDLRGLFDGGQQQHHHDLDGLFDGGQQQQDDRGEFFDGGNRNRMSSTSTRIHPIEIREVVQLVNLDPPRHPQTPNSIANDAAIAHILQEELSKLAAEEAKTVSRPFREDSKGAALSQDSQVPAFKPPDEFSRGEPQGPLFGDSIVGRSGTDRRESEAQPFGAPPQGDLNVGSIGDWRESEGRFFGGDSVVGSGKDWRDNLTPAYATPVQYKDGEEDSSGPRRHGSDWRDNITPAYATPVHYRDGDEDSSGPRRHGSGSGSGSGSQARGKGAASSVDYESYQFGDDEESLSLALALSEEEHRYDEEVAKRLTKLESIRHVPRTNADEMPTMDAASMDHARLLERLIMYGLNERKIQGDGNCQFRALSDQLYRTPDYHKYVRKAIVSHLKAEPQVYSGYVPMGYNEYLKKMGKNGEWGDHVTLQAAADNYGVKIWLITSFKDTSFIEILPVKLQSGRVIYLSFWAEIHYNSIYPEGDQSGFQVAPKKKHWLLRF